MKNIALYYRVSTEQQDLASQKTAIAGWLDKLEVAPKKIYTYEDMGISGRTLERPSLQKMVDDAYRGKIDTIVVYRLDRFSRDATAALRLILSLDSHGVAFVAVSQPVLNLGHDNPFRRTMLAAFAEIAEIERETIVSRVQAGLAAARKRGVVLGAPKKLNAEKASQALALRKQGLTIRKIAAELSLSSGSVCSLLKQAVEEV